MNRALLTAVILGTLTLVADAQPYRRLGGFRPPERIDPIVQPGGSYNYWMIHHDRPLPPYPPYPHPYPWPYPYPVPYPVPYYPDNVYVNNFYQPPPDYGWPAQTPSTAVLPAPTDNTAVVAVVLPTTAAVVWFDGERKESGLNSTRVFTTPPLDPGHKYHYTVKAEWVRLGENVSQSRVVTVSAGKTTVVDFTKPK